MSIATLAKPDPLIGRHHREPEVRRLLMERYDGKMIVFCRDDEVLTAEFKADRVRVWHKGDGRISEITVG